MSLHGSTNNHWININVLSYQNRGFVVLLIVLFIYYKYTKFFFFFVTDVKFLMFSILTPTITRILLLRIITFITLDKITCVLVNKKKNWLDTYLHDVFQHRIRVNFYAIVLLVVVYYPKFYSAIKWNFIFLIWFPSITLRF